MTLNAAAATADHDVRSELVKGITEMMTLGQQALDCAIGALEQGNIDLAVRALSTAAKAVSTSGDATLDLQEDRTNTGDQG